jgi:cytochrome c-type biogenesis protein CcsB
MALLLIVFATSIAIATFIESKYGTSTARALVYNSVWFEIVLLCAFINLCGIMITSRMHDKKKLSVFILHLSLLIIIIGAATTRFFGKDGYMHIREGEYSDKIILDNSFISSTARHNGQAEIKLPFSLQLQKFILMHYPGSESPSWYESKILLIDKLNNVKEDHRIYMNNVLTYKGYRFFQSSYDSDELGTILSVNYDFWGTLISYTGYFILLIGILFSFINPDSRLRKLYRAIGTHEVRNILSVIIIGTLLSFGNAVNVAANNKLSDSIAINPEHARKFGELLMQDPGGRIKPINTLSSELIRKITYSTSFKGMSNDQVMLGMMTFPEYWQKIPIIRVSNSEIQNILHITGNFVSFADILYITKDAQEYILEPYVNTAYHKPPDKRSKFDNDIMKVDERINLCYQIYTGELLHIFPKKDDPGQKWYTPSEASSVFQGKDSIFTAFITSMYLRTIKDAVKSGNWAKSDEVLGIIKDYQKKYGFDIIPSETKIKLEILYNELDIFQRLSSIYGLTGFVLLILGFLTIFLPKLNLRLIVRFSVFLLIICFFIQCAGLITRWYISGHAPWSNAYESMIYISFATVLAGILFSKKSVIILAAAAILSWLILFIAHLSWMDPQITNLVPVLKSYWLLIHVAVITASYGFLSLGAIIALINLIIMIFRNNRNAVQTSAIITKLSLIIEIILIIGLYMLTIGTFLGGVRVNEKKRHYWGWDPKETWALVSILVYAVITHMRLIPGLKGIFAFNIASLLGFSSVIMTYFGVNYYLTGLHSYAKGDSAPVPLTVYYTLIIVAFICILAWWKQKKFENVQI